MKYNTCKLGLSGWYHGKTAGLLGTMDNEPSDDFLTSEGRVTKDLEEFTRSWSIEADCISEANNKLSTVDGKLKHFCQETFFNKSSEFSACFNIVSPHKFKQMCSRANTEAEACTIAMGYLQVCAFHDSPLRLPDTCASCSTSSGTKIPEGQFRKLENEALPKSSDVVFIVEAKECNRALGQNRSVDQVIGQLSKELADKGITENRWALAVFGGDGVYDQPRSLILDNQIFTKNPDRFIDYFKNVPVGNGNQDIFAAIGFASKLSFRAGVSKTFILMPCSHCESQNQTVIVKLVASK